MATDRVLVVVYEALAFVVCWMVSLLSLWLLMKLAREEMVPRPQVAKRDVTFMSAEKGQNWSWDWCLVFKVQRDDDFLVSSVPEEKKSALRATTSAVGAAGRGAVREIVRRVVKKGDDEIRQQFSLRRVVERLGKAGLETKLFYSLDRSLIFVEIRATLARFKEEAARIEYKLLLDEADIERRLKRGFKDEFGRWKWYPRREHFLLRVPKTTYDGVRPSLFLERVFDTSVEDESTVYKFYEFIYGPFKEKTPSSLYKRDRLSNSMFRTVDRLKLLRSIIEAGAKNRGAGMNMNKLLNKGALEAAFPLHSTPELLALQTKWLLRLNFFSPPLSKIKDYFGEKIGLYFLFLGHFATWLSGAAIVGFLVTLIQWCVAASSTDAVFARRAPLVVEPFFAIFMSLWAIFFLESWKETQATAVMQWGMTGFEAIEQDRPEFRGTAIHSPITGFPELYFPRQQQRRRFFMSFLVVCVCLLGALLVLAGAFVMQAFISNRPIARHFDFVMSRGGRGGRFVGMTLSHLVIACASVFGIDLFKDVAESLNGLENHKTQTHYEDHLIAKIFVFRFVVAYVPFFYVAAIQRYAARNLINSQRADCFNRQSCFFDLSRLLATVIIFRDVVNNFKNVVFPLVANVFKRRRRRHKEQQGGTGEFVNPADSFARRRQTSHIEEQFQLESYHYLLGPFDDYAEAMTTFGYSTLFATAFPLAPLFAMITTFIQSRFDAWKLCQNTRRAWPAGAEDIGTWQNVLSFMAILTPITNSFIVAYTGETFQNFTVFERLIIFTLLEYVFLGLKVILLLTGHETPPAVALQVQRQDFLVSKIILNAPDEEIDIGKDDDDEDAQMMQDADTKLGGLAAIHVYASDPGLRYDNNNPDDTQQRQIEGTNPKPAKVLE